jgi:hypothetical protein
VEESGKVMFSENGSGKRVIGARIVAGQRRTAGRIHRAAKELKSDDWHGQLVVHGVI